MDTDAKPHKTNCATNFIDILAKLIILLGMPLLLSSSPFSYFLDLQFLHPSLLFMHTFAAHLSVAISDHPFHQFYPHICKQQSWSMVELNWEVLLGSYFLFYQFYYYFSS